MLTCRPVWYIPSRYVSTHNHTTMDNQRMSWRCVENGAKQDISTTQFFFFFFFSGVQVRLCVYLGSPSCPCWDPWPRPSSYIREAWKRALGHLEQPISSQSTGYGEVLREDGDWETEVGETTGRVDECGRQLGEWMSERCVQVRGKEGTPYSLGGTETSKANFMWVCLFFILNDK